MSNKFVNIIVPTYNDWARLRLCVDALAAQTYPQDWFDVTVVNNNPADSTPAGFTLPSNIKIITEARPGSYAARNAALNMAQGEIIGFTDSDCIPDKNWIKHAVEHFQKEPSCSRIAGKIAVFPKGSKATLAEKYDRLYAFRQKNYVTKFGICVTGNLFAYKYVFDKVGLFNDSKMSFGDLDWGRAAHLAGYRIDYGENVIVNHPARDWADLVKKEKRLAGGREGNNKKTQSKLAVYTRFLKEARLQLRGEMQFINKEGDHLNSVDKVGVLLMRSVLNYVKAYETMRLRLGKRPNRE